MIIGKIKNKIKNEIKNKTNLADADFIRISLQ